MRLNWPAKATPEAKRMAKSGTEETDLALKELAATDLQLVRVIEDLIRILVDRDILDEGALPIRVRRLLARRRELRHTLH
jgi:hypothetical protein